MHSHGLPGPSGKPSLLHSFCRLCDCLCSIQTGCSKALGALGSSSERPQGYGELQLSEGPTFRWLGCKPDDAACAQRQDAGHRAIDGAILMRLQADRPGSITIVLHPTVAMQAKYENMHQGHTKHCQLHQMVWRDAVLSIRDNQAHPVV